MQRRLEQNFTLIWKWGQGTCLLTKHTLRWAYSRYFPPACCLLRFAAFFFSVATFSHRRSARIKKLILRKLTGSPKNLGVDTFPDPLRHFGAPWRPFWILQVVRRGRRLASAPFAARLVFLRY